MNAPGNKWKRKWNPTPKQRAEWQQKKINQAHASRANDPVLQAKIDAQAYVLLRERVAQFGAEWHVNCAIRLPAAVKAAIAQHGTDVLLLLLDKEMR